MFRSLMAMCILSCFRVQKLYFLHLKKHNMSSAPSIIAFLVQLWHLYINAFGPLEICICPCNNQCKLDY
uniref:Uncharacterized protein n=1 Tax=Arundo donax TaxID=35708 RepID=A0A0A9AXG1_ARUDO